MNVSYSWLKAHVDLEGISPEEVADKLTFADAGHDDLESFAGVRRATDDLLDAERTFIHV